MPTISVGTQRITSTSFSTGIQCAYLLSTDLLNRHALGHFDFFLGPDLFLRGDGAHFLAFNARVSGHIDFNFAAHLLAALHHGLSDDLRARSFARVAAIVARVRSPSCGAERLNGPLRPLPFWLAGTV